MKTLCRVAAVLIFASSSVVADLDVNSLPIDQVSTEHSSVPKYRALFEEVQVAFPDQRQDKLLAFYSEILPWLRSNAYLNSEQNFIEAYSIAEEVSFRLAGLIMTPKGSMDQSKFEFYERIVINDAYDVAQELTVNVMPNLVIINKLAKEEGHVQD